MLEEHLLAQTQGENGMDISKESNGDKGMLAEGNFNG